MSSTASTEPLLVRVDPDTKQRLKVVAESSERTLSQLVRYATVQWTSNPDRKRTLGAASTAESGDQSEFINVRFSSADMDLIREVATEMGIKRGAAVRCAVRAWLAAGDFAALGDPRAQASPDLAVAV